MNNKKLYLIFFPITLATALFFFFFFVMPGFEMWYYGVKAKSYPCIKGSIQEINIHEKRGGSDENDSHWVVIRYKYIIKGKTYHNDRYSPDLEYFNSINKREVVDKAEKYSGVKTINVCYNPKDPSISFISVPKGIPIAGPLLLLLGIILMTPWFVVTFLFLKESCLLFKKLLLK